MENKTVLLAILARNKAHVLSQYLECIENLEYNKKLITIYINTNNNKDNTQNILENWTKQHKDSYSDIIFESHEIKKLNHTNPHHWTKERVNFLGKIRNKSLQIAKQLKADYYFVVDCDNFIVPNTLRLLIDKNKPIIAPMLRSIPTIDGYSNFFCAVNPWGYYKAHPEYQKILTRTTIGTFKVPVVHCTYLIDTKYLDKLSYTDDTSHHEFVIFSRNARKNNIDQYICNEQPFGFLVHLGDEVTLDMEKKLLSDIPTFKDIFLLFRTYFPKLDSNP